MTLIRLVAMGTVAFFAMCISASAQSFLTSGIKFVDKSTGHKHDWRVSSSAASNQGFNFPASAGTVDQVLKVTNVTDGDATFAWATGAASLAETATRLTADVTDATAWSTGPEIAVECGKTYRIAGEVAVVRGASGANDQIKFQINCPTGTVAEYSIECMDCPAGTTSLPQFVNGTAGGGQSVGPTAEIDPNGSNEGVTYTYRVEGFLNVSCPGSTGTVRLTFNKSGGSAATTMKANSYWALIEIQ